MQGGESPSIPGVMELGVFVDEHRDKPPYGEQNTYLERLAVAAREMRINLYAFSIPQPDVDRGRLRVRWPERAWSASYVRLPKVVYDRAIFTKRSEKLAAKSLLQRLRSLGVKVFNPAIGSKLAVYKYLASVPGVRHLLPPTEKVTNLGTVHRFLRKWGDVFVKPSVGTQGTGVLRIQKHRGRFTVSGFTNNSDLIVCTDLDWNGLGSLLKSTMGSRTYLVQKTVQPLKWLGSSADVRALVQKDGQGEWSVTGLAARVAHDSSSVCNLHRGGRTLALAELCRGVKATAEIDPDLVEHKLCEASMAVARALEKRCPLLGELGLDFIVSVDGSIWLIEANPRPGRNVFRNLGMRDAIEKSVARPLEYARYLESIH